MLKKYRSSGRVLPEQQLKAIKGGNNSGEAFYCSVNSDCGSPYCDAPTDVNCWVCIQHHGNSFCSWFEPW